MNLLTTKNFNGIQLDCYQDNETKSGDFWATREQIGELLEYSHPEIAIGKIHERNKTRLANFSTLTKMTKVEGNRTVTRDVIVYNFRGLLEICRYSNQPIANKVMDFLWSVADEIRRTGMYVPEKKLNLETPDKQLYALAEKVLSQRDEIQALEAKIKKDKPKVDFADRVACSDLIYSWQDGANSMAQTGMDIGQNRFIKWALEHGYLCRRKGHSHLMPTLKAIKQGIFEIDLRTRAVRITPKGVMKLTKELCDDGQYWLFDPEEELEEAK